MKKIVVMNGSLEETEVEEAEVVEIKPEGEFIHTVSPFFLPVIARPKGEIFERRPLARSDSKLPTIVYSKF